MPAAAVIPAPIAYIKVAAVKKLVVGFLSSCVGLLFEYASNVSTTYLRLLKLCLIVWPSSLNFYFEEIRVFGAGLSHEYISMG